MSVNVNISVSRAVPPINEEGLTLVVFRNALQVDDIHEPIRINSLAELYANFTAVDGTVDFMAAKELYVAEYLLRAGVNLLCYSVLDAEDGITAEDITAISDIAVLNYKLVMVPYLFLNEGTVAGENTVYPTDITRMLDFVKAHSVQMFLDLYPFITAAEVGTIKTDLTANLSAKVELVYNTGLVQFKSGQAGVTIPTDFDLATEGAYVEATDFVGIPGSAAIYARKALLLAAGKPEIPVAGEVNGLIPEFTKLLVKVPTVTKEAFQAQNVDVLVTKIGVGNLFVSQNTMYKAASDDLNNPLLRSHAVTQALYLKRKQERIAESALFAPNNQKTWDQLSLATRKIFKQEQDRDAIEDFVVNIGLGITMTKADVDAGIIKLESRYVPVKPAEQINISMVIQESTGSYQITVAEGVL